MARDLVEVIDRVGFVAPDVGAALAPVRHKALFTAPEMMGERWAQAQAILVAHDPHGEHPHFEEIREIWNGPSASSKSAAPVRFSTRARASAEKRLMAGKKKRKKKGQTFCQGVMKSCRKRGKAKTPFCKSALKSCRKKARKGGGKRRSCPKGRVTRGKRKGRCRK